MHNVHENLGSTVLGGTQIERGRIVRSVAGHDQNSFYVVVMTGESRVYIADGKLRKLSKPKAKNIRHIRLTADTADTEALTTDKKLRELLKSYNDKLKQHCSTR